MKPSMPVTVGAASQLFLEQAWYSGLRPHRREREGHDRAIPDRGRSTPMRATISRSLLTETCRAGRAALSGRPDEGGWPVLETRTMAERWQPEERIDAASTWSCLFVRPVATVPGCACRRLLHRFQTVQAEGVVLIHHAEALAADREATSPLVHSAV